MRVAVAIGIGILVIGSAIYNLEKTGSVWGEVEDRMKDLGGTVMASVGGLVVVGLIGWAIYEVGKSLKVFGRG